MCKKINKMFLISIFMLFALNSNVISQNVQCDDCQIEPWITEYTYTIISGCPVQIEYEYKSCDDYNIQIRLKGIRYDNTSCSIGISVLMDKAVEELMFELKKLRIELGFDPPDDLNILIAVPFCAEMDNSSNPSFLKQCTNSFYCCKEFTTTWAVDTILTIDNSWTYSDNCNPTGGCSYSCETIDDISTGPIPYNPEGICGFTCPNSWDGKKIEYVNGSCTLTINYMHRTNCVEENEIILDNVLTEGSCGDYSTSDSIVKRAINEILKAESPNSSSFTFKVNSCWKSETFGSVDVWQRCVPSGCCEAEYFVTYDDPDTELDSYTRTVSPMINCTIMGCNYLCDDDHLEPLFDNNDILLKPIFDIDKRVFTTFNNVIPNPSNGLTKFVLESPDEGIITLNIYDMLGNKLISENIDKKAYHKEVTLDLGNFNNGTYHFKYEFEGQIITSGSFIIHK